MITLAYNMLCLQIPTRTAHISHIDKNTYSCMFKMVMFLNTSFRKKSFNHTNLWLFISQPRQNIENRCDFPTLFVFPQSICLLFHTLSLPVKNGGVYTLIKVRHCKGSKIHWADQSGIKTVLEWPTDKSKLEDRHFQQVQM